MIDGELLAALAPIILFEVTVFLISAVINGIENRRNRKNRVERLISEARLNTDLKSKKRFKKGLWLLAVSENKKPKYKKASKIFRNIMIRTDDPLDKAYCSQWTGRCYEMGGNAEFAAKFYHKAIEIAPSEVYALGRLADYYYFFNKNAEKSEHYCKQSLEYDPTDPLTYYRLGKIYSLKGQSEKAISQYKLAISVSGSCVSPIAETAIEYAKIGDKENSLRYYLLAMANDLNEFDKLEEVVKSCFP